MKPVHINFNSIEYYINQGGSEDIQVQRNRTHKTEGPVLSTKKEAEEDDSYGTAKQIDFCGNVAGADSLLATDLNEFNQGVRQLLLMQKKMANRAGE